MSRNKLYLLFLVLSTAGYSWIFWNLFQIHSGGVPVTICLFKKITGIPCPSCGTTLSVLALIKGNFYEAFAANPLGFIIFTLLFIVPLWILIDLVLGKDGFYKFYSTMERFIRRKWIAYPAILLLVLVWLINILFHHGFH